MKLYVVEHRMWKRHPRREAGRVVLDASMEIVVAYIATSMAKARAFCRRNKDYDNGTSWWWAIYNMRADRTFGEDDLSELCFVSPAGKRLESQPSRSSAS